MLLAVASFGLVFLYLLPKERAERLAKGLALFMIVGFLWRLIAWLASS